MQLLEHLWQQFEIGLLEFEQPLHQWQLQQVQFQWHLKWKDEWVRWNVHKAFSHPSPQHPNTTPNAKNAPVATVSSLPMSTSGCLSVQQEESLQHLLHHQTPSSPGFVLDLSPFLSFFVFRFGKTSWGMWPFATGAGVHSDILRKKRFGTLDWSWHHNQWNLHRWSNGGETQKRMYKNLLKYTLLDYLKNEVGITLPKCCNLSHLLLWFTRTLITSSDAKWVFRLACCIVQKERECQLAK